VFYELLLVTLLPAGTERALQMPQKILGMEVILYAFCPERYIKRLTFDRYSYTFTVNERGLHKLVMRLYINCALAKMHV
jgi:hypothetical protein